MRTASFTAGPGPITGLFTLSCVERLPCAKFTKKCAHPMNFVNFAAGRCAPGAAIRSSRPRQILGDGGSDERFRGLPVRRVALPAGLASSLENLARFVG